MNSSRTLNLSIDLSGELMYRNGEKARVLCLHPGSDYPIITQNTKGFTIGHTRTGSYQENGKEHPLDLINV